MLPAAAVPASQAAEVPRAAIIPADLDGELSQQLQKLSKRDATTKLKALQVREMREVKWQAGDVKTLQSRGGWLRVGNHEGAGSEAGGLLPKKWNGQVAGEKKALVWLLLLMRVTWD